MRPRTPQERFILISLLCLAQLGCGALIALGLSPELAGHLDVSDMVMGLTLIFLLFGMYHMAPKKRGPASRRRHSTAHSRRVHGYYYMRQHRGIGRSAARVVTKAS